MTEYAYATEWNHWTGRPTAENRWLSEDEARELFEADKSLEVVEAILRRDSDGAVRARWVMGFAGVAGVRVQWLNAKHSILQINDYSKINGRLFRTTSIDYAYPDSERRYGQSEATALRKLTLRPNGTGTAREALTSESVERTVQLTDYRTDNLWMDYPAFGDWAQLGDNNFGRM